MTIFMICEICERETPPKYMELHHLIPKLKKTKEGSKNTIDVCCSCGDMIHQLFNYHELNKTYNTLDKIVDCDKIQKWKLWISKKPNDFSVCMRKKKKR